MGETGPPIPGEQEIGRKPEEQEFERKPHTHSNWRLGEGDDLFLENRSLYERGPPISGEQVYR